MTLSDHEVAISAAEAGAAVVRAEFGRSSRRYDRTPGDFSTDVDLAAERTILAMLRDARPDDGVLGEETGCTDGTGNRTWLVDPLCGTLNYAAETTEVAVNVALRVGADVTAAASADPFTNEVFWTDHQAARIRHDRVDVPAQPSAESRLVDINLDPRPNSPAFSATALLADGEFNRLFRPRVMATTLAVAWVGAGRRAAYLTAGDLRDNVHFAAGIAFCRAAGCVISGIQGQPLHTGEGGLIVAADQTVHTALLEMLI